MRILLTGATGYIGKMILPVLLSHGHDVICCVRNKDRFESPGIDQGLLELIEVDFLEDQSLEKIPDDIDAAYYLIHSMSSTVGDFDRLENISAENFRNRMNRTRVQQVIYLSGIINENVLSKHLSSRRDVENVLAEGRYALTTLRAGIVVGAGSASFEIIRDLVEKLPVMVAPRWLNTRAQPIAIRNVVQFLKGVLLHQASYHKGFDIGGTDILTYREMLLQFAQIRKLRRFIWVIPFMTPRLSSYWLYFITSTSYRLAVNLVNSMKVEVVCEENDLNDRLGLDLLSYKEAVSLAFDRIEQQEILSSWSDAYPSQAEADGISQLIRIPENGCFIDRWKRPIEDEDEVLEGIWNIGRNQSWYYARCLWEIRGALDKLSGGSGLRWGRNKPGELAAGDAVDFWRVLHASRSEKRLLLYAEMKLPGEAWLEFRIRDQELIQTVSFRPLGLRGRIYYYMALPFHALMLRGMISMIAKGKKG
jgi:uncharacterized protein YbjT (DUF2867 family)